MESREHYQPSLTNILLYQMEHNDGKWDPATYHHHFVKKKSEVYLGMEGAVEIR
jgi:hypothetical protein